MSKKPEELESKPTLSDDQIGTESSKVDRRSALKVIGATVVGAGAATVASSLLGCIVNTQPAQPTYYQSGVTDGDAGPYADPAGGGRGARRSAYTGVTDNDSAASGQVQDPGGYGRGHYGRQGWTSGVTDSDGGSYADPAGNGRGTARMGQTGLTDSDGGPYADPAGHGRGRYR